MFTRNALMLFAVTVGLGLGSLSAQTLGGYDLPTLGVIPDNRGCLYLTAAPAGRGDNLKPDPQYCIITYTTNKLSGNILHPKHHADILKLVREVVDRGVQVSMKFVNAPGLAGGYIVTAERPGSGERWEKSALIIAIDIMRDGRAMAKEKLRSDLMGTGLL